jgi:hypothetical protein
VRALPLTDPGSFGFSCKDNLVRVYEELRAERATLSYQALTAFCRRIEIELDARHIVTHEWRSDTTVCGSIRSSRFWRRLPKPPRYGHYDLDRLERMILRRGACDYFTRSQAMDHLCANCRAEAYRQMEPAMEQRQYVRRVLEASFDAGYGGRSARRGSFACQSGCMVRGVLTAPPDSSIFVAFHKPQADAPSARMISTHRIP